MFDLPNWKLFIEFCWVCLKKAFKGSALIADSIYGGIGLPFITVFLIWEGIDVAIPEFFQHAKPGLVLPIKGLVLYLYIFGFIAVIRLLLSPFLIYKEQKSELLAKQKETENLKGSTSSKKDKQFLAEYSVFLQTKIQQAEQIRDQNQFIIHQLYLEVFYWYETVYEALEVSLGTAEAYKLKAVYDLTEIADDSNKVVALRKALLAFMKHLKKLKSEVTKLNFLEDFELLMLVKFSRKALLKTE